MSNAYGGSYHSGLFSEKDRARNDLKDTFRRLGLKKHRSLDDILRDMTLQTSKSFGMPNTMMVSPKEYEKLKGLNEQLKDSSNE